VAFIPQDGAMVDVVQHLGFAFEVFETRAGAELGLHLAMKGALSPFPL